MIILDLLLHPALMLIEEVAVVEVCFSSLTSNQFHEFQAPNFVLQKMFLRAHVEFILFDH